MSHHIPLVSSSTLQNFSELADLLAGGDRLEPTSAEMQCALNRGLEKKAPFHLNKNSAGDALIIELYGAALNDPEHQEDVHCFVRSNYLDFSTPNGDRREPHPDRAAFFNPDRSGYFYRVEGLDTAPVHHLGAVFTDEAEETESLQEEPRTLAEIVAAEREFFDKVWYVRKLIFKEKIKAGVEAPIPPELEERMEAAMPAIEERYGPDNVGPWNDWGWGFVHGKLSTLRWVLGSDWDFLDT